MSEIAKRLRETAAERRRIGWELSDAMLPGDMDAAAGEIERLQARIERSQRYWIEAAEIAIQRGDFRPLQIRIDAARSGPIDITEIV